MPRKGREEKESYGRSWWRTLFRVLWFLRYVILIGILVANFAWQWPLIERVALLINWNFGWGLALTLAAFIVLVVFLCQRRFSCFFYRANRWLGGLALLLAAWGILAFYDAGGFFGEQIIGRPNFLGGLRVAGLAIIGLVLIFPRPTGLLVAGIAHWLAGRFRKQPEYLGEGYDVPPTSLNTPPTTVPPSTKPQPIPGKPLYKGRTFSSTVGGIFGREKSAKKQGSVPVPSWMRPEPSPDLTPPQPPPTPTGGAPTASTATSPAR